MVCIAHNPEDKMHIDNLHFSPYAALAGGLLIGLAAALLVVFSGRIAGISGILGTALRVRPDWRWSFIAGLVAAPWLYRYFAELPEIRLDVSWPLLLLSGGLVGYATRLANGCTSGHGVCGLARFSRRSLVATMCFMGSGFITVFILRHVLGA
jgi:uncharacterized membrane protein YedE/YeeE